MPTGYVLCARPEIRSVALISATARTIGGGTAPSELTLDRRQSGVPPAIGGEREAGGVRHEIGPHAAVGHDPSGRRRGRVRQWHAAYLHEITTFPNGRHDDQVGSTAQMLDWFKRGSGPTTNAGIFEYYRQLAEEARNSQPRPEPLSVMSRRLGILRPL